MKSDPTFLIIDLFCGAGGTTSGFAMAKDGIAKVIACVNHDPKAIESHWKNHPEVVHFEEDIRTLELSGLVDVLQMNLRSYPGAKVILWASLECTNFSKAKGGQPRDADSRTLADHLDRYVVALNPDYIQIENVVEFMAWGPLDENGKPISRRNGQDWLRWKKQMCSHGYYDEWRELNAADFGAYTSRNRLFGVFAKHENPVCWPEASHTKKPEKYSLHKELKKWMPVKDVLNFSDEGESIFTRKKPLSDKTLERIYAGLIKYVAKGDKAFISKYFSGRPKGKVNSVDDPSSTVTTFGNNSLVQTKSFSDVSIENPAGTITTKDHHALVQPISLIKYNSTNQKTGKSIPPSIDEPAPVISTQGRMGLVQGEFLTHYYGSGGQHSSVESPAPTIPTKARTALVKPEYFIDKTYTGYRNNQSIDQPAGSILPTDKHRLIRAEPFIMDTQFNNGPKSIEEPAGTITANRKHHYLLNPCWKEQSHSIDEPSPVIIARQDKTPLYFVQVEEGEVAIAVYPEDSEICIRIKEFMAIYRLIDIKMRMLRVIELLRIQGFPEDYFLAGNQADQKKFIGNSVHPYVVKVWIEAFANKLIEFAKQKVA
jgi:DNA (cytosine-5)-methyltransferase 1